MRNKDEGVFVFNQIAFQPFDMIIVQMVGRLIQKKNIRVFQEQLAERDPRFLSAGEGVSLLGKSFLGKAQTLQYT